MALPIPPSGRAVGQLIAAINDGPDPDSEPEIIGVRGTATFTATVTHIPVPGAEPNPYTILPRKRTGVFDPQGFLCTPQTNAAGEILTGEDGLPLVEERGVNLVATEIDGAAVTRWHWVVTLRLTDDAGNWEQTQTPFTIPMPAGGEVDLTEFMDVPGSAPEGTDQMRLLVVKSEQSVAEALRLSQESAASALDARQSAEVAVVSAAAAAADAEVALSVKEQADNGDFVPQMSIGEVVTLPNPGDDVWMADILRRGTASQKAIKDTMPTTFKGDKGDTGIGWTGAALSGTTDLNTVTTPGVYTQDADLTTTVRASLNYPPMVNSSASTRGTLLVIPWSSASGAVIQEYRNIGIRGQANFPGLIHRRHGLLVSGVASWGPWSVTVPQRMDNTAGRAVYTWDDTANREQLVYGDTGSRNITDMVNTDKWRVVVAKLRRQTSEVELRLQIYPLDGVTGTDVDVFKAGIGLPAGFRNQHTMQGITVNGSAVRTWEMAYMGTYFKMREASGGFIVAKWQTTDPWPLTLPGIADSAVPTA